MLHAHIVELTDLLVVGASPHRRAQPEQHVDLVAIESFAVERLRNCRLQFEAGVVERRHWGSRYGRISLESTHNGIASLHRLIQGIGDDIGQQPKSSIEKVCRHPRVGLATRDDVSIVVAGRSELEGFV